MWKLTIEDDEGQQTSLELARAEYTIGRADGCSICLTERNVSRAHCVVRWTGSAWTLGDTNSYNGTYVNGERVVDVVALKGGDIIQLADYRIELLDEAAVAAVQAQAQVAAPMAPEQRRPSRLVMVIGPTPGMEYPLVGEHLALGRAEDASISINHSSVSRNHAELHALGDGRWEIIDLGSSNGIRINGVDLRRGILEAGDAMELGDVRLRFVAAGKYFRPMVDLSANLPGLSAATPAEVAGSLQRTIGKVVAIGAAVCVLVVVGWAAVLLPARPSMTQPTGTDAPMATNLEAAKDLLNEAIELSKTDLDKAHTLLSRIPESSPVRDENEFKDIENKWADAVFARVAKTNDAAAKRKMLSEVRDDVAVDAPRRQKAADMLAELGPDPQAGGEPGAPGGRRPYTPGGTGPGSLPTAPPATATTATKTDTKTAATAAPGGDQKYDENAQRRALEGRVWGGSASEGEIKMLRAICSTQGDRACRDKCTALLKQKQQSP
jgi:pSer/pThr/pTyr-binding forkhead associated (FHA) protein